MKKGMKDKKASMSGEHMHSQAEMDAMMKKHMSKKDMHVNKDKKK